MNQAGLVERSDPGVLEPEIVERTIQPFEGLGWMQGCLFAGDAHQTEPAGFRPEGHRLEQRPGIIGSRQQFPDELRSFPDSQKTRDMQGLEGQALRSGQRFSAQAKIGPEAAVTADGEGQNRAGTAIDEEMARDW